MNLNLSVNDETMTAFASQVDTDSPAAIERANQRAIAQAFADFTATTEDCL